MSKLILERHRYAPELNVVHRRLPRATWADPLVPEFARIPAPGCTSLAAYRAAHRPAQQTARHVVLKARYLDPALAAYNRTQAGLVLNHAALLPTIKQVAQAMRDRHNAGPLVIDVKVRMVRVPIAVVG